MAAALPQASASDPIGVYGKAVAAEMIKQLQSIPPDSRVGTLHATLDTIQDEVLWKKVSDLATTYGGGATAYGKASDAAQLGFLERALAASMSNDMAQRIIGLGKKYPNGVKTPAPTGMGSSSWRGRPQMGSYVTMGAAPIVRPESASATTQVSDHRVVDTTKPENLATVTTNTSRAYAPGWDAKQLAAWYVKMNYNGQAGPYTSDPVKIKSWLTKDGASRNKFPFYSFSKNGSTWSKFLQGNSVSFGPYDSGGNLVIDFVADVVAAPFQATKVVVTGAANVAWDATRWGAAGLWSGVKWIGETIYKGLKFVWEKACDLISLLGSAACMIFNNSVGPLIGATVGAVVGAGAGPTGAQAGAQTGLVGAQVIAKLCGGGPAAPILQSNTGGIPMWMWIAVAGVIAVVATQGGDS